MTMQRLGTCRVWFGLVLVLAAVQSGFTADKSIDPTLKISCFPAQVRSGEVLRLRFSFPHAAELGIRGPDNRFRWIVWPRDLEIVPPVISQESFKFSTELTIPVDALVTNPADNANPRLEPIFSNPGTYVFLLSNNLESDRYPVSECKVNFIGTTSSSSKVSK